MSGVVRVNDFDSQNDKIPSSDQNDCATPYDESELAREIVRLPLKKFEFRCYFGKRRAAITSAGTTPSPRDC
jgi:hypothetical protein